MSRQRQSGVEAQMGDRSEGCHFVSGEVEAADDPTLVASVADPGDRAGRRYVALDVLRLQRCRQFGRHASGERQHRLQPGEQPLGLVGIVDHAVSANSTLLLRKRPACHVWRREAGIADTALLWGATFDGCRPKPVWCVLIADYCGCALAAGNIRHGVSSLIRLMGCPSAIFVRIPLSLEVCLGIYAVELCRLCRALNYAERFSSLQDPH